MSGWVSACASSNCVQVRRNGGLVEVADEHGHEASFTPWYWETVRAFALCGDLAELRGEFAPRGLVFDDGELITFVGGVVCGRFDDLTAEWKTAEPSSEPPSNVDPDNETCSDVQPVSVAHRAVSGPVASDDHPAVLTGPVHEAARAVMHAVPGIEEPDARRAAAEVFRWFDQWLSDDGNEYDSLRTLADEIDPKENTQ